MIQDQTQVYWFPTCNLLWFTD